MYLITHEEIFDIGIVLGCGEGGRTMFGDCNYPSGRAQRKVLSHPISCINSKQYINLIVLTKIILNDVYSRGDPKNFYLLTGCSLPNSTTKKIFFGL